MVDLQLRLMRANHAHKYKGAVPNHVWNGPFAFCPLSYRLLTPFLPVIRRLKSSIPFPLGILFGFRFLLLDLVLAHDQACCDDANLVKND